MRTLSADRLLLVDRRRRVWGDPVVRPFNVKLIGGLEGVRRGAPAMEIGVIPDVIALALAQLVRDRWAAEMRGYDEGRGSLRVLVTKQCR